MQLTDVRDVPKTIRVESEAFAPGADIPKEFTAEGENRSPPVAWSGLPEATQELALVCQDPDAPGDDPFVHWVVYKIPLGKERLDEGRVGDALEGRNDFGRQGWGGPKPPRGHGLHHYHFLIYALDKQLDLAPGLTRDELIDAMEGHLVAWGECVGTYQRS